VKQTDISKTVRFKLGQLIEKKPSPIVHSYNDPLLEAHVPTDNSKATNKCESAERDPEKIVKHKCIPLISLKHLSA
jgi:hypothetical protein